MDIGNHHDVTAGVRETVQDDKCMAAAVNDQRLWTIGLLL